jgi:polysaccharide export outer membrane protein
MRNKFVLLSCILLSLASCKVPKDVAYFQGIDGLSKEMFEKMHQTYNPKICEDDMLTINVSSWDPTVTAPYNPPAYGYYQQGEQQINTATVENVFTYIVDREGFINFPVLGRVHVAGLSTHEANTRLQDMIRDAVPDVLVNVQIINFRVGIFGEVSRPNAYVIRNSRISILDLIVLAGDLTINANRKNLLLLRDNNGVKEFARFDMTDPAIFESPYFYLRQNDIVYVEPNNAKKKNANYSSAQQYTMTIISTIVSSVSLISSTVIAIISISKNK